MLVIQRPTVEAIGEAQGNRQTFAVSPLEPGFGHTLGNSLRRTLLSSIPGAAITQLRFDDALHEFDTIAGVTEDVTDIILNLKDLVLVCHSEEPVTLRLDVKGPADITAGDISQTSDVEILNPDLHIATLNKSARLAVDITVSKGRGYVSADRNKGSSTIGVIPVDSIFSPVRRVAFQIEPTRVEQSTAYDRLVLDIETDGSINPREALASAGDTLRSLVGLVAEMSDDPQGLELGEVATTTTGSPDLDLPIEDLDLSERPRNCLKRAQVNSIGELLQKTEDDLLAITNFGQKSPRRGHPEARRARPAAAHEGLGRARHAGHPEEGPSLRRQLAAPAADDGQPRRVPRGRRGHRHHRGQGQGAAPGGREGHHQGQEGRAPQPPPGRLVPRRQGDGPQALHRDRAALRRPQRRLHPHPEARHPPGRQRPHGAHRAAS